MSSSPEQVSLSDVQASLSLFAEALTGHPVSFRTAETAGECWPSLSSQPGEEDVVLPPTMIDRNQFRALVLQQVLIRPCPVRPSQPTHLFRDVYAVVEDHRVHALTRRVFPGATRQLDQLLSSAAAAARPQTLLDQVRLYTLDYPYTRDSRPEPRPALQAAAAIIDRVTDPGASAATSAVATKQLCRLIADLASGRLLDEILGELEGDDEEPALPSDSPTSVSLDGGAPSEFVESDGLGGGQLLGDGDELVPTAEDGDPGADNDDQPRLGLQLPTSGRVTRGDTDLRTFVYDEWDYHQQQHRPAWCTVIEEQLEGDDHGFITDVRMRHQTLRARIRRSFMKLRSDDLVRVYRSDDGDELDLDAAIEAMADRRSGAPVDDRLHIRRDRAARDVATAFLVDLSASTSSAAQPPLPEPQPEPGSDAVDPMDDPLSYGPIWDSPPAAEPVRRVIDVAKDAVALMGDALHELGDRYAIYGFSGTGREAVEFKIGKDFGDRVSPLSWAAVAEMKPLRYTRMGPAVRHAATKLAAEPARTKLLIVVSDGYPQDTDYGEDRHDRDYGIHDTARALADANSAGIETFCVTIDPAGHDYLRVMCPDHRYLVIEDVESLPEELARLYMGRFNTARSVEVASDA